jgi:hypothetical protein
LIPDQKLASVPLGEAVRDAFTMLPGALDEVGGDAGIDGAVALIRRDVDLRLFHLVIASVAKQSS